MPGARLPDALRRGADAQGEGAAKLFAMQWGGRSLYIPKRLRDDSTLCVTLGQPLALAMIDICGPGAMAVPRGPWGKRRRRIDIPPALRHLSAAALAARLDCDVRSVRRAHRRERLKGSSRAS